MMRKRPTCLVRHGRQSFWFGLLAFAAPGSSCDGSEAPAEMVKTMMVLVMIKMIMMIIIMIMIVVDTPLSFSLHSATVKPPSV